MQLLQVIPGLIVCQKLLRTFTPIEEIEKFCGSSPVLVAGSTWPEDEKLIKDATANFPDLKIIIAPHEIHKEHIDQLKINFPRCSALLTTHSS